MDPDAAVERLQARLDHTLRDAGPLRVIDAGSGAGLHLRFPEGAEVTAVDISPESLARNTQATKAIVGDLEKMDLPQATFDVAVCWDTLEHLRHPHAALSNIVAAVRPGGIVVLAFPNPTGVKGIVTKCTPFRVHVWLYRSLGHDWAGDPSMGPFKTYMRFAIAPAQLTRFANSRGCTIEYVEMYTSEYAKSIIRRNVATRISWRISVTGLDLVTFGRARAAYTDVVMILRRAEGGPNRGAMGRGATGLGGCDK